MTDLRKLTFGFEMVDVEGDSYVVRFHSNEDYLKVLEGGLWIVMGHYLSVSKWRPNFRLSMVKIRSTIVWAKLPESPLECFNDSLCELIIF